MRTDMVRSLEGSNTIPTHTDMVATTIKPTIGESLVDDRPYMLGITRGTNAQWAHLDLELQDCGYKIMNGAGHSRRLGWTAVTFGYCCPRILQTIRNDEWSASSRMYE